MPSILFVCTANKFRSPIAAAYFTRKLNDSSSEGDWIVGSAGTWTQANLPAHPRALIAAARLGLDLTAHHTREVDAELLSSADVIVVMEKGHQEALASEFPSTKAKMVLLGNLARSPFGEITDPAEYMFENAEEIARVIGLCIDEGFAELVALGAKQNDNHSAV